MVHHSLYERHIRDFGHGVIVVFPTKPEHLATFCYTIGRAERGKAELFISGVHGEIGGCILNNAAAEIDRWARDAQPGDTILDAANFPLKLGSICPPKLTEYLCQAVYRGEELGYPVRALQLVMCDSDGRYPGEPGFNVSQMQGQVCMAAEQEWDFDTKPCV